MDYTTSGSSVHGISQARIMEWVAISFSRGSSQPRVLTQASCTAGRFFTTEPPGKHTDMLYYGKKRNFANIITFAGRLPRWAQSITLARGVRKM